jgi:hypothetical protein
MGEAQNRQKQTFWPKAKNKTKKTAGAKKKGHKLKNFKVIAEGMLYKFYKHLRCL